jgi:hypothetical protein
MSLSNSTNNQFSLSVDGLTELNTDVLTVNGISITGDYLNSKTDTSSVNTIITLDTGSTKFTVKDTTANELLKCDNATHVTSFYRPQTAFTGQNTANDIPNLLYGLNTYWFKSGSNGISGAFQTAPSGSIWFQDSIGQTYILMNGISVQINNPLLTGDTNLFTIYNNYGGVDKILFCDPSGNLSPASNLSYLYGDLNATMISTVPSNISAQQQTIRWTRDFTVNSLYGWKLSTETINKMPLDTDLPITINNLYSTAMYPTLLVINGLDTTTEIKSSKIRSNNSLLTLSNSTGIEFTVDSDRFKFFGILDLRAIFVGFSGGRFQYNTVSGWNHTFAINSVRLFSIDTVSSIPTITSNGYFTLTDNVNNKVYSDGSGLYCQGSGGGYFLGNTTGSAFLTSSSGSSVALSSSISIFANAGGNLSLNQGASLYSKTNFTCSLGVNNTNIISVYDDQHGNDTLFFSRNTNDPNILFGTDITLNNVIGQATSNASFSTDSIAGDLVIRNNNKNIRLGTANTGASTFIIRDNGGATHSNRSPETHQFILSGQEYYQASNTDTGVSLNIGVNRPNNHQLWIRDVALATNSTNKMIRMSPQYGYIDCIATDSSTYYQLSINSGWISYKGCNIEEKVSTDRLDSFVINTLRAGINLISNLTGSVHWNFWSGGSAEAFGSAWYLYNQTSTSYRLTVQSAGNVYLNAYTTNGTLSVTGGNGLISSSSDIRLKENINYITDTKKALEQVLQLRPCEFNFIANKEHTQLGLIAQDVEKFIPISVDGKKYEYQAKYDIDNKLIYDEEGNVVYELNEEGNKKIRPRGLDYNAITATQILAIQELHKRIELQEVLLNTQNQVIQKQQAEITDYKDKINHLLLSQENQLIELTNQINKITEKIINSNK